MNLKKIGSWGDKAPEMRFYSLAPQQCFVQGHWPTGRPCLAIIDSNADPQMDY